MSQSNKTKRKLIISLILNLSIVILELLALFQSVLSYGLRMFEFYTIDSNLFALVACSICSVITMIHLFSGNYKLPLWAHLIKYMSTCCLTVTFVIVVTVLAPPRGLQGYQMMMLHGEMLYHHFLCPVIAMISFLFFEPLPLLTKKHTYIALLPTITYALITLVLNILRVIEGPYPFLHIYEQPVFMSCIWFVVIIGIAYLLALILRIGNKKIGY